GSCERGERREEARTSADTLSLAGAASLLSPLSSLLPAVAGQDPPTQAGARDDQVGARQPRGADARAQLDDARLERRGGQPRQTRRRHLATDSRAGPPT